MKLIAHVTQCKPEELHPYYIKPPAERRQRQLVKTGEMLDTGPIYLFVEGLVIFAEPSLVALMHELVWLDVPWRIAADRRYKRGSRLENCEDAKLVYRDHVHVAHTQCRRLLEFNVQHRHVLKVNAAAGKEQVFREVLAALEKRCSRVQRCLD